MYVGPLQNYWGGGGGGASALPPPHAYDYPASVICQHITWPAPKLSTTQLHTSDLSTCNVAYTKFPTKLLHTCNLSMHNAGSHTELPTKNTKHLPATQLQTNDMLVYTNCIASHSCQLHYPRPVICLFIRPTHSYHPYCPRLVICLHIATHRTFLLRIQRDLRLNCVSSWEFSYLLFS